MNPDTAVQDGIDEVPLCLAWSKRGGVCGQKLPCDGSLHRESTFEEQVDSHFARLEGARTPSVALVEERTEGLTLRDLLDGLLSAAAEPDFDVDSSCRDEILARFGERTGVGDVQAVVLGEVDALRRNIARYAHAKEYDEPSSAAASYIAIKGGLDRIEAAVRRGEQR